MEIAGNIIIGIGIAYMLFGLVGLFRFKKFFQRLLVTSKIDTVGMLTIVIGLIIRSGFGYYSGRLVILAVIIVTLNPFVSHIIARSAYLSGFGLEDETIETDDDDLDENLTVLEKVIRNVKIMADAGRCTGCARCAAVCPHGYIKMEENKMGFYSPQMEDCEECGLCLKSCPYSDEFDGEK